jgi:hypothetical protein
VVKDVEKRQSGKYLGLEGLHTYQPSYNKSRIGTTHHNHADASSEKKKERNSKCTVHGIRLCTTPYNAHNEPVPDEADSLGD